MSQCTVLGFSSLPKLKNYSAGARIPLSKDPIDDKPSPKGRAAVTMHRTATPIMPCCRVLRLAKGDDT
ncbi:hypothetical protein CORC01_09776 [Colletotrichum orchidophilum]|uniref:Uncharacterized protein n=1 Tax=Colletotrichum orchidophilum TaxID=1209926 RepID=A0A1G4B0Z8_9PEZI|nr:uncharacterized protein CORC01_09776 [Colletotrichum orchidophilum]OHE94982.1 hypothetical protein CORC01_09776 [Colletotrichum orchidophilum]